MYLLQVKKQTIAPLHDYIKNMPEDTKYRYGIENNFDLLLGQWAWLLKDEEIIDENRYIVEVDFNDLIETKTKTEIETEHVDIEVDQVDMLSKFKESKYYKSFFMVDGTKDNVTSFSVLNKKKYKCDLCGRYHENNSNRPYIFADQYGYKFGCRSNVVLYYSTQEVDKDEDKKLPIEYESKLYSDAHVDIAKLLWYLNKDKFAFCGKKAPFYYYNGTYWSECDSSIILRKHLYQAVELYEKMFKTKQDELNSLLTKKWKQKSYKHLLNSHEKLQQDYDDAVVLKIEKLASQLESLNKILKGLGNRQFRDNVIEEWKVLHYDANFMRYLDDKNKHLIGFENGVYDLKLHQFRESKASDYISITTGYDYHPTIDIDIQNDIT